MTTAEETTAEAYSFTRCDIHGQTDNNSRSKRRWADDLLFLSFLGALLLGPTSSELCSKKNHLQQFSHQNHLFKLTAWQWFLAFVTQFIVMKKDYEV